MTKKATGAIAYITIIGWFIAFIAGDRKEGRFHLNQALVVHLASIIIGIICSILGIIPLIGFVFRLIGSLVNIVIFIYIILGIVYAVSDRDKELPVIGGIRIM